MPRMTFEKIIWNRWCPVKMAQVIVEQMENIFNIEVEDLGFGFRMGGLRKLK